jgi:hypothetical protein
MVSAEKFCLRWNDFESNISVAFRELREDKDFFDVTLACDDDQIQAHKVILSACSPFFRSILKRNRHEHPLLYLKGVNNNNNNKRFIFRSDKMQSKKHQALLIQALRGPAPSSCFYNSLVRNKLLQAITI